MTTKCNELIYPSIPTYTDDAQYCIHNYTYMTLKLFIIHNQSITFISNVKFALYLIYTLINLHLQLILKK